MRKIFVLFCFAFFAMLNSAYAAEITDVRWSVQTNPLDGSRVMRVVIDVSKPVGISSQYNEKNKTLSVDIKGATPGKNTGTLPIKTEKVRKIVGQKTSAGSKFILNFASSMPKDSYKVFVLKEDVEHQKSDRVVIDIIEKMPKTTTKMTPTLKGKTILIDPGHGGSDPGAIGPNKTYEKDITLKISLKVRDMLIKKGAKVAMTRTKDANVCRNGGTTKEDLQARVDIGAKAKADVFVSIHNNANVKRDIGGLTTYYTQKSNYDTILAKSLQKSMSSNFGLENKGIRQAGFYVTKHSAMPAALLEIAFISNPKEEKLLNSNWFQTKMANCIVEGLEDYFKQASGGGK